MPAEELGQRYFTRERIRNRMLKRAAEVWGYSESEMDEFDPLVTLLIEACALEFERTASEIGKTQNRMLERLAQLMYPEITMVRPAYAIMQAASAEPSSVLTPDAQFLLKPSGADKRRDATVQQFYFSPVKDTHLINGHIACMATCREIYSIEEGVQKSQIATAIVKTPLHQHTLWLGLSIDPYVESLEKVNFFFNWLHDPDADTWYQNLSFSSWSIKGHALTINPGMADAEKAFDAMSQLEQDFDSARRIEDETIRLFNRQFVTITQAPLFEKLNLQPEAYPAIFEKWYDKRELKELKAPLYWIEIKFPTTISPEALDAVLCGINCFPVLNRKLNKLTYKLQYNLNIVPLESEGSFLSVKEIANTSGQGVKMVPFGNPYELQPETYTLRYGVNRFNERNSYETLVNLLDLIREESSFFSSLGEDFLTQHVRELNQLLARMESKVKLQNKHEAPYPFLAIRSGKESATVLIEFWSCMGEAANRLPLGSKLSPYQDSNVRSEHVFLMTTTFNGRDNLSDADKLVHYKKALFTRNRIVTPEDVRMVAAAELGRSADSIEIKKTFMRGVLPGDGFVRCIQVLVTPADDDEIDVAEWEQKLLRLKVILEKQSAGNLPYHISLKSPVH
jgi:hypothetical protein